jgi:transposase
MSTKALELNRDKQMRLFEPLPAGEPTRHCQSGSGRVFLDPDPETLYLGQVSIEQHLRLAGIAEPFVVRRLLAEQDWRVFEAHYAQAGRAPYAPRSMLGLILYGIMQGVSSLRGLERLARMDIGAMWVSGGICPDHANLGRFITLHGALLSNDFFAGLTRSVLKETGTHGKRVAGDGTVIEAACSHYGLLKEEAAREQLTQAQRELAQTPADTDKQAALARIQEAHAELQARKTARQEKGKATDKVCVSLQEPEARVQPLKRGRGMGPSYKPSVLANEGRVVLGMDVHPSSETGVLPALLDQIKAVSGEEAEELLLDAGYCSRGVLQESIARDISLLCPEGKVAGQPKQSLKYYAKSRFRYDDNRDAYLCPNGQWLVPLDRYRGDAKQEAYIRYATPACKDCPVKSHCTRGQRRTIKRYASDELKDALRTVMQQPQVQALYAKRQAMVEPVFSVLRLKQGLNRFRRHGLAGVKCEFALHILAYNLSRAVAVCSDVIYALLKYCLRYLLSQNYISRSVRLPQGQILQTVC